MPVERRERVTIWLGSTGNGRNPLARGSHGGDRLLHELEPLDRPKPDDRETWELDRDRPVCPREQQPHENGQLAEHWDVIQDQVTKEGSVSGLPMFGDKFPG